MELDSLLLFYVAYGVAIASPGPSTMAIMGTAMQHGRKSAGALALGVVTGSMIWAVLAASGVSVMLTAYAQAIVVLKIAGGAYLLCLAWKSARAALIAAPLRPAGGARGAGAHYRRGMLLHLTNPKAILGWIALIALGVQPDAPAHQLAAIIAGCAVLGLCVNLGYAMLFSTPLMVRAYERARRAIDGALAVIFGFAGLRLLLGRV